MGVPSIVAGSVHPITSLKPSRIGVVQVKLRPGGSTEGSGVPESEK